MWVMVYGILVFAYDVWGLAQPSFISGWHHLKTDGNTEFIEYHGLEQLPVYVDVQVDTRNGDNEGYNFPGVGSAQSSDDVNKEVGGVVYIYDETKVVVKCPDGSNGDMQAVFTGDEWEPTYSQKEKEAWVRVRVWSTDDFPSPIYTSGWLPVSVNDATKTYLSIDTSLSETSLVNYFITAKVRVSDGGPLNGMVCDAQGSSMAFTSSSQWGGVIYQSRGSVFHIWTPAFRTDWAPGKGSICNIGNGWGNLLKGYGEEGDVLFDVYDVIGSENFADITQMPRGTSNQKSFTSGSLNSDTDIVVGKVYKDVGANTYVWPAFGGVFFPKDSGQGYGGVVFAYSNSKVRMWYPDSDRGFYIDSNWGTESSVTKFKDWTFVAKVHRVSTCGTPISIADGEFTVTGTQPFSIGTEVTYWCNPGLSIISGDSVRTCSHSGWNGTLPFCGLTTVRCGTPSNVSNGTVYINGTTEDDVGFVTCDPGFDLIGSSNITCQLNGLWSTLPSCQYRVNCSTPPSIENGTINYLQTNIYEGDTANVTCHPGFNISGSSAITCQSNGSWAPITECIQITILPTCSAPQDVLNGTVYYEQDHTIVGDTANITCNTGFNISGNSTITCQENGTWSTSPSCVSESWIVNCSNDLQVDNGTITFTTGNTSLGDTANIFCNHGLNISGHSVITCQENGTWTALPTCQVVNYAVNCSSPQQVENGTVNYNPGQTLLGDTANISCNYGFSTSGTSVITCQENGTWTTPGACYSNSSFVNCSYPLNVTDGTVTLTSGKTFSGDTANVLCDAGFNIDGTSTITCQTDGYWTALPTCVVIQVTDTINCSAPPDVDNGIVNFTAGQTNLGDTVNVTCSPGFNISGSSFITCQENSTWTALPNCTYNELQICFCNCSSVSGSSNATLEEQILEIVQNLTVPSKSTSKYRRTKESAEDDRTSATTIGYVGGVFLGVSFGFILVLDISNLYRILNLT